jgi:hypothetical protein
VRHLSGVSQFEIRPESIVNANYASEWEAEDHDPNHVLYRAPLDRGLGVDHRRWRWRLAASLDEGAMAADQRLVRPAFGRFGLSGNGLVIKKIRGGHGLRFCSAGRCSSVFRRGENCFGGRKLI